MSKTGPGFTDIKPFEKAIFVLICLFWVGVAILFFTYSANSSRKEADYKKAYDAVNLGCQKMRAANKDYSPEGAYELYHDNGPSQPPICRHPANAEEVNGIKESRSYRQQLENGDIDPPSADEHCYSASICQ